MAERLEGWVRAWGEGATAVWCLSLHLSAYTFWYCALDAARWNAAFNRAAAGLAYRELQELLTEMERHRELKTPERVRNCRLAAAKFFSWGVAQERLHELLWQYFVEDGGATLLPPELRWRVIDRQTTILMERIDALRSAVEEGARVIFQFLWDTITGRAEGRGAKEAGLLRLLRRAIARELLEMKQRGLRDSIYRLALDLVQP
ncbi:MAG: hypothetical protein QXU69_05340 [Thermofilaceae archaeon]